MAKKLPENETAVVEPEEIVTDTTENSTTSTATENTAPKKNDGNQLLKPIIVLVVICLLSSSLLVGTNYITQPIIAENTALQEDTIRKELLPDATSFEDITPNPLPEGISSVYKANDDIGYVIGAYSRGYGGKVPVLVGIDATGTITNVQFLANDETPGLGQKVVTDKTFAEQFVGRQADIEIVEEETDATAGATQDTTEAQDATAGATPAVTNDAESGIEAVSSAEEIATEVVSEPENVETTVSEAPSSAVDETAQATATASVEEEFKVQAIAAATISSDAAANAVETALQYYAVSIMGSRISYRISDDILQSLLPNATSWKELDIQAADIAAAYIADDGTYVLVAQGKSQNVLYAAVALNENGTITGLWLDTSNESPNYGLEIAENEEYISQYIGKNNTDSIQGVAGVTNTSRGIKAAVDAALAALPQAKEAA